MDERAGMGLFQNGRLGLEAPKRIAYLAPVTVGGQAVWPVEPATELTGTAARGTKLEEESTDLVEDLRERGRVGERIRAGGVLHGTPRHRGEVRA